MLLFLLQNGLTFSLIMSTKHRAEIQNSAPLENNKLGINGDDIIWGPLSGSKFFTPFKAD